jgi:hypothetical protein
VSLLLGEPRSLPLKEERNCFSYPLPPGWGGFRESQAKYFVILNLQRTKTPGGSTAHYSFSV